MPNVSRHFLAFSVSQLRLLEKRIETCTSKLTDDQIWSRGHENENAVGNLVLHLSGNVRQWIVSSLGGAPDNRKRDAEFSARGGEDTATLLARLNQTVDAACKIIEDFPNEKLEAYYTIQDYKVSGVEAIYHVVEHFAMHTGQIIFLTKMLTGEDLGFYRGVKASSPNP